MPRALGVEQDYEQWRTAAQDRIAEKQAELHAVMLRKAATEAVLPLSKTADIPKPERVGRLLAALRLCRWDVTAFRRQWFEVSPVRVVQRSEFLTAADIPCVAAFPAFPISTSPQQRCRAHEVAGASRAASPLSAPTPLPAVACP